MMAMLWAQQIMLGKKTFAQVPKLLKEKVREILIDSGMEELAEEVSISYEHMNKVERGKHGCSLDLLLEFSAFFEVSTDYLLTGRDFSNMVAKKRLQTVLDDLTAIIHGME